MKEKLVLGLDIGAVNFRWYGVDLAGKVLVSGIQGHNGKPRDIIIKLDKELEKDYIISSAVATGSMSDLFQLPIVIVPEQAAQEKAAKFCFPSLDSFNVLRLGGSGFSLLTHENGEFECYFNDRCSTGTGTAIEMLCQSRYGLSVEDACLKALEAKIWHDMAARCSVFLKSEMTHLANKGCPQDQNLKSYFYALAKNIWGFVQKRKVSNYFILIGGVANNRPIEERLSVLSGEVFGKLDEGHLFEAMGAARISLELFRKNWLKDSINLRNCFALETKKITNFKTLKFFYNRVVMHKAKDVDISEFFNRELVLGFDFGSTGSKAIVMDKKTKDVACNFYVSTKGNPVGAAQELIKKIPRGLLNKIVKIGFTGSGGETVAIAFRAVFPDLVKNITVKTEITAHAKGACYFDSDGGASISIVEIGGQDAKYILIHNGEVVDSSMNFRCAAGTGSFLEEQARLYEICDPNKFGDMAEDAECPANLGQHCTVFVAEQSNKALQEGVGLDDVAGGFYYSVIYNYVNRVMGKRMLGDKIFLQGTPAKSIALALALSAVMDRKVIVPPNPGAMGAVGIALCALEEKRFIKDQYFDLDKFLEAEVVSRKDFACEDVGCGNRCIVTKTVASIKGNNKTVFSGGMCSKYEKTEKIKLPKDAPNPFREREELLSKVLSLSDNVDILKKVVGIPVGLAMVRFIPFFVSFFKEFGLGIKLIETDKDTMEIGDGRCSSPDMCAPVKMMHGLFDRSVDYCFLPKIENLSLVKNEEGSCVCPLSQSVSNLIEKAVDFDVKLFKPVLDFKKGIDSRAVYKVFKKIGAELGFNIFQIDDAFQSAVEIQNKFQNKLLEIGKRAIDWAKKNNVPVVLVCGRLYVITNSILNSGIPRAIQENGAIAIPVDCYPVCDDVPVLDIMYWGAAQRNIRAIIDSLNKENVFVLWLSSYGCGPDSFLEHFVKRMCREKGKPHTVLETDGHSGIAGFMTRVIAFLDTCRNYIKQKKIVSNDLPNLSYYKKIQPSKPALDVKLIIPSMGKGNEFLGAACRSIGIDAVALPPVSVEDFMEGKKECSGKECLPFILLWGSIKNYLKNNGNSLEDLLFFVSTTDGPCRYCMYHIRIRQLIEDLVGLKNSKKIKLLSPSTANTYSFGLNSSTQLKMWTSVVAFDLLRDMLLHVRPIAKNPEQVENCYNYYVKKFVRLLEQPSSIFNTWGVAGLMKEAAYSFNNIPIDEEKRNNIIDVAVIGEIYVRGEPFANNFLVNRLESLGMRVKLAPNREWINYVGYCDSKSSVWKHTKETLSRWYFENKLYKICAKILGWPHDHSVEDIVEVGFPYLGKIPTGEAILGIGSLILLYELGLIKGGILVGPYGCMPTKIAEAQLNRTKVPFITVYCDGEPIDEKRLAAFAWQLGGIKSLKVR